MQEIKGLLVHAGWLHMQVLESKQVWVGAKDIILQQLLNHVRSPNGIDTQLHPAADLTHAKRENEDQDEGRTCTHTPSKRERPARPR